MYLSYKYVCVCSYYHTCMHGRINKHNLLLSVKFHNFLLGTIYNKQNITRWLEDMTFIFSC
jgi:hypothetical protein